MLAIPSRQLHHCTGEKEEVREEARTPHGPEGDQVVEHTELLPVGVDAMGEVLVERRMSPTCRLGYLVIVR